MKIELNQKGNQLDFEGRTSDGQTVHVGASAKMGGSGTGIRAMQMVALSLASCSSIDILTILRKQRQTVEGYAVEVDAHRAEDRTPAVFDRINVHYMMDGDLDLTKVKRAIELSLGKYCSVAAMLEKTAEITYSLTLNGESKLEQQSYE